MINENLERLEEISDKYVPLISLPAEREMYAKFENQWKEYLRVHEQLFQLAQENQLEQARAL